MLEVSVKRIAEITGGEFISSAPDSIVEGFSIDSRAVREGQFFIALNGKNFNGHDFVEHALKSGAKGVIVEKNSNVKIGERDMPVITVNDTYQAMSKLAGWSRKQRNIPIICITGTNGKTTVKDMLSFILSSKYNVLFSKRSYNNIVGLSLTLLELDKLHDIAVLEIGSNHPGEIKELAEMACPDVGIITNIGNGHLEFFGNKDAVFFEKTSLINVMAEKGALFLGGDDIYLRKLRAFSAQNKFYGCSADCDFIIDKIKQQDEGYTFFVNGMEFMIAVDGVHNVHNAVAAIATALYLGMGHEEIRVRLKDFSLRGMRLQKIRIHGVTFINDAYNSNPDSFEAALKTLQEVSGKDKKGIVAGDMIELGEEAEKFHRMIGKSIADKGFDFLVVLGERAGIIADAAYQAGMNKDSIFYASDHKHAAEIVRENVSMDSVVLVKGSRELKMEEVIECFTNCCIL
ncbi:MAG: UDP-N-acetylmuramoyl-tripeptide--D-alanyl-D-alanine ligase [Candidatus Omnitrophota bacterium]